MFIAQLSDPHITARGKLAYGRVDTNAFLERTVAHVLRLDPAPEMVWITGDLAAAGQAEEYQVLRELLAPLPMPVYVIPGNHDDRGEMRVAFADHAYLPREGEFLHYVVEHPPLRMIGLDTHHPGEVSGLFCEARLAWLEDRLDEEKNRPTVLLMHHPPFHVGIPMDRHWCQGGEALAKVVARHPNIERVLCGHVHRLIQLRWAGTVACAAPSTAHQVFADFTSARRSGFAMEPPGFLLHHWREPEGLVTHHLHIGEFDGPYPFSEED